MRYEYYLLCINIIISKLFLPDPMHIYNKMWKSEVYSKTGIKAFGKAVLKRSKLETIRGGHSLKEISKAIFRS